MALPKSMRLKGHRTFAYVHKNSVKYYGRFMTLKIANSNPNILISHKHIESLNNFSAQIQEFFLSGCVLNFKDENYEVNSPRNLVGLLNELSRKGVSVQRYKGLGEMNPDQLWDTTLDPAYRSILKVKIDDAQRADEIFSELMGEDVDKRKIFIQSNAKKVSNLDV